MAVRLLMLVIFLCLSACIPVISSFYEPQTLGDIRHEGACSMSVRRTLYLNLESGVTLNIEAISKGPGNERSSVSIGLTVPAGVEVRLLDMAVTLQEGVSQSPVAARVDRIHKPRSVIDGRISDYLPPGETMTGPAGYGIEVDLPRQNPPDLLVTVPSMSINGRRVEVEPVRFTLKTRLHTTGLCS